MIGSSARGTASSAAPRAQPLITAWSGAPGRWYGELIRASGQVTLDWPILVTATVPSAGFGTHRPTTTACERTETNGLSNGDL
jgi:hypothetical protein